MTTPAGFSASWVSIIDNPGPMGQNFVYELKIDEEDEYKVAGQTFTLSTGQVDDDGFFQYWRDDDEYEPTKVHLEITTPHENWIERYDTYTYEGQKLRIPIFKDVYTQSAFPALFSSDRLGWIGEFTSFSIDWGIAFSYFMAEFVAVAGDVVLLGIEFYGLVSQLTVMFGEVASGVPPTSSQVELLFISLSAMFLTFGDLLTRLKDLPVDPDDPLRLAVAQAGDALLNFLSTEPWYDDITIKGVVNNCNSGEAVKASCRDVNNKNIAEGSGQRTIEPFPVSSIWERGDGLLFRDCQLTISGQGRSTESARFISYATLGGMLNFICGLSKGKSAEYPTFLQRILNKYPHLFYLIKL